MKISYNKLWKLLIDRKMKKMDLKREVGIGSTTLAKLSKDQPVSMDVMVRLCEYFNVDIGELMEILHNN